MHYIINAISLNPFLIFQKYGFITAIIIQIMEIHIMLVVLYFLLMSDHGSLQYSSQWIWQDRFNNMPYQ